MTKPTGIFKNGFERLTFNHSEGWLKMLKGVNCRGACSMTRDDPVQLIMTYDRQTTR